MIRRRLTSLTKGRFDEWVFWTRFPSPELVEAIRGLSFSSVVYEPVDRYAVGGWFSLDEQKRIQVAEAVLIRRAMVVTTTAGLAKRFEDAAGGSYSLPLGKDSRLKAIVSGTTRHIGRPRLAVVGSLDWLADEAILVDLATQRSDWHLVLAGPRDPAWGRRLEGLQNVHWLGKLTPEEARGVIADCDVALNPCVINEWTECAIPVKIFDYLAEGRPVVSTPMAELDIFREVIEMAPAAQFVQAVERALRADCPDAVARRRAASERFTLQDRARAAFELVSKVPVEASSRRLA
ncbi:MAG: glycosyltransferase [Candidatus Dormibacteraeota bacterium]|nr:glycosyltransferase [Candidatus Dormibacteraeota bacterium]